MPIGVAALPPNSRVLLWVHFRTKEALGQCRPRASFVPFYLWWNSLSSALYTILFVWRTDNSNSSANVS